MHIQLLGDCKLGWVFVTESSTIRYACPMTVSLFCALKKWFSRRGPQTSSLGITWELVGNAHSWALPQTYWVYH